MRPTFIASALFALALWGCGTANYPTTGAEFKQVAATSSLVNRDAFEVKRSFAQVARTLERKSAECLNYSIQIVSRPVGVIGGSSKVFNESTKSTVTVANNRAELTFKVKHREEPPHPSRAQEPPDGVIFLVADASPAGNGQTKIEIVRARVQVVADAIRAWASGNDKGCPDPARVFPR